MNPLMFLFTVLISTTSNDMAFGAISPTRRNNETRTFNSGDAIWQDEFDFFDKSKWSNEINMNGGGNKEFEIYDDYGENAYVRDGILYIRPTLSLDTVFGGNYEKLYNGNLTLEGCTDKNGCSRQAKYPHINQPVVSQRLRTKGTFSFRYGRVLARARMPSGDWTWPAIWMLPEDWKYGSWPVSGEVDIVESRGNRNYMMQMVSTLGLKKWVLLYILVPEGHTMVTGLLMEKRIQLLIMDLTEIFIFMKLSGIRFKVDGGVIKTVQPPAGGFFELGKFPSNEVNNPWVNGSNPKMAPFDENFHFILNVAVGGEYFPRDSKPPPPWGSTTPFLDFFNNRTTWSPTWSGENAAMAIDYIRVYAV